jgi:SAM-dependent methyltransferase
MSNFSHLNAIKSYFSKRIQEYGASPRGVGWNSDASQNTRFDQLLKVIEGNKPFSLLDYGCGYGALADYLLKRGFEVDYYGFDIVETAVDLARKVNAGKSHRKFITSKGELSVCDYTIASGIFNVRDSQPLEAWTDNVIRTLHEFNELSRRGFASNFLTKYSDADRMRADLYYADPCFLFDYCKRNFSKNVALLHDYKLYDFTILVRKG